MPSIQHEAVLEVRLYNADNSQHREIPLSAVAPGVSARVTHRKGYEEGSITLYGKRSVFPGLVRRRRMEFYARYRNSAGTVVRELAYRGYVDTIRPSKGKKGNEDTDTIVVTLAGIFAEASKKQIKKRYANSAGADKARFFADFTEKFVTKGRLAGVVVQALDTTDIPLEADFYDLNFGQAVDRLYGDTGKVVTGGDVDPLTGADRLFYRPFDLDTDPPKHTLIVPSNKVGGRSGEEDSSRQVTVLRIKGGVMGRGKANLLAEAVEGNTSFEMPELSGDSPAGNLIEPDWTAHSGADASGQDITPFVGETYFELPEVGSYVENYEGTPSEAIQPGQVYVFSLRARRLNSEAGVAGEARLYWLDTSDVQVGSTVTVDLDTQTSEWKLFSANTIAPASAARYRIQVECTSTDVALDSEYNLLADDVRLFRQGAVTQRGWGRDNDGASSFNLLRWDDDTDPWHGGRCVYVDVESTDDPDADAALEPLGQNRFTTVSGATIVGGFVVKKATGSPDALVRVQLREWDVEGDERDEESVEYTITSTDWIVITATKNLQEETAQGLLRLLFRSDAQLYIDGAFVFDSSAPAVDVDHPETFVEADNFETVIRAVDLFPSGAIFDEATEIEDIWDTANRDEITNQTDAEAFARAYFERYVLPLPRPYVQTSSVIETAEGRTTVSAWPGEFVRAIGLDGEEWLPEPKPIFEKLISWSGQLGITFYLSDARESEESVLTEIIRRNRTSGTNSKSSGSRGGFSGSAGAGGGSGSGVSSLNTLSGALTLAGTDGVGVSQAGSTITVSGADLADDIQNVSDDLDALDASLGTASVLDVPSSGNATSGQVVKGDDTRLTNARTPTAHKSTHATGGTDALTASDIGAAATSHNHAATDITTGTMATARLGSGTADGTTFLRGDNTWAVPSGGGGGGNLIYPGFTKPLASAWTTGNMGTGGNAATLTDGVTGLLFQCPAAAASGINIRYASRTKPTGSWFREVCIIPDLTNFSRTFACGIGFRNSSTGELVLYLIVPYSSSTTGIACEVWKLASPTASATISVSTDLMWQNGPVFIRIYEDASNRAYFVSLDGEMYTLMHAESKTAFTTPDQVVLACQVSNFGKTNMKVLSYA